MLFDDTVPDEEDMFADDDPDFGPAPDTPAALLSPRTTDKLIGHDGVEKQLLHMFTQGRFPHGLVFSGPAGVGKSVMAFRLARFLFAQAEHIDNGPSLFGDAPESPKSLYVAADDPVFQRVASGGNQDLWVVERPIDEKTGRQKGSVPVDEVRKIAPFLRMTSSVAGGWRVVIIDDADTMTRSSQNSLLKILEEPPERSLLILITHRAGALLPTVYSRCVHIPFAGLPDAPIAEALQGRVDKNLIPQIVTMAEGSLGQAYDYASPENADLIAETLSLLATYPQFSWLKIQKFADTFGSKGNDDEQRIFRETMLWVAGALVRGRATGFAALQNLPLERRIKLYDALRAHIDRCQIGNLDKRFLIMGAYMVFEH